jgi:hypothetical protein
MVGSELAADFDLEQAREHSVVADFGMAIEREVSRVERDVAVDQSGNATIDRTHERTQAAPKETVVHEQAVGVLLRCHANRRVAHVHGGGQPADLAGIADLQAIQSLGGVGYFLGDAQVLVEVGNQSV